MHFILIHGSWHGKWSWNKLVPILEAAGHQVTYPDLPGCGEKSASAEFVTFDHQHNFVREQIAQAEGQVILVAHSFSGLFAASIAEEFHRKIQHTFYIASWLPREGYSLVDMAMEYNNSDLPKIITKSKNPLLKGLDPIGAKDIFYHDCSAEDQEWASKQLKPKPGQLDYQKLKEVNSANSLCKSTYLLCSLDRVVNPLSQQDMVRRFGFSSEQILKLPTGHSPFLSKPQLLASILTARKEVP